MKSGIYKRLSMAAVAAFIGLVTACASDPVVVDDTPVHPTNDDYVKEFRNGDNSVATREELLKESEKPAKNAGTSKEVSSRTEMATRRSVEGVSDKDLKDLAQFYANEAARLYADQRYEEALVRARDALLMDPDNAVAADVQANVEQALGIQRSPGENMAAARSEEESALRGEAIYEISHGLDVATRLISEGQYSEAIAELEKVLDIIRWTDYMIETEGFEREARLLLQDAEAAREKARLEDFVKIREQERRLRELEIQQELDRYREEISNLYDEAKEYFDRREYKDAVIVLNKILREDPYNEQVSRLKQIATNLDQGQRDRNAWEDFNRSWRESMELVKSRTAMPTEDVELAEYEHYMRSLERARTLEAQRQTPLSKEDISVRSALETVTLTLFFEEATLDEVIAKFRTDGNINILRARAVDGETPISLDVGRVKLRQALDLVADYADLSWRVENGAVIIDESGAAESGNVVRRVFNVADLLINLRTFRGDEPRLSGDTESDSRIAPDEEEEDADPVTIEDLMEVIEAAIDPPSWGLDGHGLANRQQDLIVLNSPDNIDRVNNLLNDLRRSQGLTVSVEARFITIRDDFLEDIGLDFRGIGGSPTIPPPGIPPVPAALDDIQFGNNSNPAGPGGTGNDSGFFFQDMPPSGNVRIDQRARVENLFDQSLGGQRSGVGLVNRGGMTFQLAFVDNPEVNAILRAVRKRERATLLTAPRLTVHNTQRGHVSILNEVAYIRDFDTNTATGVAVADPVVDVIRDGIVLDVRPTISADRRYITLELRPTLAVLLRPIPTFTTSLGVGTPVAIQTPQLTLQRIRTTVTVPDGGSFVIGGLRQMSEVDVESGIPFISDLPLIGALFTRKGRSTVRQDIIIVVSARIIDLEEEEDYQYGAGPTQPR
jgi:type II secretory pathway component GspD/PulD (secretin)/tetratricopeptide (TPR) repeat protein